MRRRYDPLKRVIDAGGGGDGTAATAPLQLVVALLVRRNLGSPVLFRQQRPGKDAKVFELVKFRTMTDPDPEAGLVTDEQRLTRSVPCCAPPAWTSCPRCGTCSAET